MSRGGPRTRSAGASPEARAADASATAVLPRADAAATHMHRLCSMPGDFGLDPLGLGADPNAMTWYRQAELQHARWAMVGVAGSVAGEVFTGINFYTAPLEVDLPMNPAALLAFQFLMMHWVEIRRWMDIRTPGSANQDPIFSEQKLTTVDPGYPGGPFDPLGFSKVR